MQRSRSIASALPTTQRMPEQSKRCPTTWRTAPSTFPVATGRSSAISVPCGFVEDLPVGLQIVGPHFSEARVLNAAHAFQRVTDWHTRIPAGYA